MKKKKYDWPKRCLSLICVLVLVSMIILQSVPVTYASDNDEVLQSLEQSAATSEPEEDSQMISTTEILPDEGIPTGTQLVNDIFQEGNTESSSGIHADENYENPTNNISGEENSDIASDNTSGNGEQGDYDNSSDIPSQPEQGTDSNVNADQNSGLTDDQDIANEIQSGENPEDSEREQPDTESNANPVQENEDIWRNSVAGAILSNDYAKDLVAIARTQLGVQENRDNFITTAEGITYYYSRYGQWAGDAYEEWSAAFVNFCIHYANIPQQYLPKSENVSQWIQQLEAMSLHISKEGYTPKEGDLVFFLKNEHAEGNSQIQPESPAHAGIVTGADEQILYTIEGNCGGMVQTETYAISSDNIYGYLDMDQVKKLAGVLQKEEKPVNPEKPADSQNPTDSENPSEADTTKPETPSDSEAENTDEKKDKEDGEEEFAGEDDQDIEKPSTYGHVLLSNDAVAQADFIHEKYISKNDNGTYDITMNVSGRVETQTQKADIDIVLLLDVSSSMEKNNKWTNTQNAVSSLVDAFNAKTDVNTRYQLVTFGTQAKSETSNWVNGNQIKNRVQSISIKDSQGTNYDQGLQNTASVLKKKDDSSNAKKVVIFLTDGKPTYYGTSGYYGNSVKGRGSETSRNTLNAALEAAKQINCDQFYGVGIGLEDEIPIYTYDDPQWGYDPIESNKLSGLSILTSILNNATVSGRKEAWNLTDSSELTSKFNDIAGSILTYNFTNVTVRDTLSDYVDPTQNSRIQLKIVKLTSVGYADTGATEILLSDTSGEAVTINGVDYGTVSYDSSSKTATWSLGANYGLEQDTYYYMKITNVIPNQNAYNEYKNNGYLNTGDTPTDAGQGGYRAAAGGTSSGKEGFYSNKSASVTYTWKNESQTLPYPQPVVQAEGTDLDLKKTDMETGLLDGAVFKLEKQTSDGNWQTEPGYENIHVDNADSAIEIRKLLPGQYRLIETKAPQGFQCLKGEIYFRVENNTVIMEDESSGQNAGMYTLSDSDNNQMILTIKNKKMYSLPSTGGNGTDLFTISGVAIMAGALLLYINKRKEEKTA